MNLDEVLNVMTQSQKKAAKILLNPKKFGVSKAIVNKGGKDYTTAADRKVEKIQRAVLKKAFPDVGFLGEEGKEDLKNDIWIVDPNDGTGVYGTGGGYFSNSGALADRKKGKILFGSVYHPESGRQYVFMGGQVFIRDIIKDLDGSYNTITRVPVPSPTKGFSSLEGCSFGTSFHYDKIPGIKEKLARVFDKVDIKGLGEPYGMINARPGSGSSALFGCEIADGRKHFALLYFQKAWDLAVCAPFARKAGCIVNVLSDKGYTINCNLEETIARCDKDTLINIGIFGNKHIKKHVMNAFHGR